MWSPANPTARHINCGLPPEFFFVAPASSFHHHDSPAAATSSATINFDHHVGVGVIPLLTATPCLPAGAATSDDVGGGGMQLWQHHHHQQGGQNNPSSSSAYVIKPMALDHHTSLLQTVGGASSAAAVVGSSSMSETATCQDCGNQAKKDCPHRRCRTCCKSRGYDCATHVKSTWVPAARRRERLLMGGGSAATAAAGSSQSTSSSKKPRLAGASQTTSHTSTSNNTPPRSFDTTSSHHQDAGFRDSLPGQVRAPAVFKCVRVTALDDGEDEYAYQAVVKIGGHVFKGFLYDQGVEEREGLPNMSELNLGGGGKNPSPPVLDPSDMYGGSGGGLIGGLGYGHPIN